MILTVRTQNKIRKSTIREPSSKCDPFQSYLMQVLIFIDEQQQTTLTLSISFGGNNWKIIIFVAFSFFVSYNFMTADQQKTLISVSIHHQIFVQKVRVQSIIIEKFLKFLDHDFSIKIFSQLKLMMHIIKNIQVYEGFEFTY